jgi:transposase
MLLHDNARPHPAARTQAMLQEFGWEVFEHPAYSPDLAPSDFHLFPKLKECLGGRRFKRDEEVKDAVKEWLNGLAGGSL